MKNQEETDPQSEKTQSELKRCISRLSYVGMGLSAELDKSLANLRRIVKSGEDETKIKKSIDQISKILRTMEDTAEPKSTLVNIAVKEADILQELLDQKLPVKLRVALQKQQEIDKEQAPTTLIINAIHQFLDEVEVTDQNSINNVVNAEPKVDANQQPKRSFFARFFNWNNTNEKTQVIVNDAAELPTLSVPDELKISLRHLVEQLSAMETYSHIGNQLTNKVEAVQFVKDLSKILESITGAFVEISGNEHRQFENFLKSLNKRIDRVNEFISNTVSYSKQVKDDSDQLDKDLKQSVTSIKHSVEKSDSLSDVKKNIYHKMDEIIERVNSFYRQQEESHEVLTQNLDKLQEQLRATEDESSRLKDDLAAQKVRAQTDPLTQLPNRYSYNEQLTQEYNRWRRYRSPLSLVIGDVDFFKKVNDDYGHDAGDEVLKRVSEFLQNELRESDFIARFGGEEFIILLPETNIIDSTKAINKLRQGIKGLKIKFGEDTIQIAMSFGISEFEDDDTTKKVFNRADKALYRAKEKGRDQVCCQRAKKTS
jgi:diguanylate cyclase